MATAKYRPDIDGLRAIAVLSVISFHIDHTWVSGGFLGVDIFFVISGYLITLILAKEVKRTHKISISNFYKRRIKRIVPALVFVLVSVYIIGLLVLIPNDLQALCVSIVWALFSAANIYYYTSVNTGYFADDTSELPLLHLWSLGVEEQFYILWPFAVLLLLRFAKTVKQQMLFSMILFVGSLIWAHLIVYSDQSFAYYMLFTRAWELLAGAMAALMVHAGFRVHGRLSEVMALVGMLLVVLSLFIVTDTDPVPGLAALPVIVGSVLLIFSGVVERTYIGHILSLKAFVAIGLVSYSAYLWHWPILAYLHYALVSIDKIVAVEILFATFLMAAVSYFFVESSLRKKAVSFKSAFTWYYMLPSTILLILSMVTIAAINSKNPSIFPWKKLKEVDAITLPAGAYKYNCQYSNFNSKVFRERRCVYPDNIKKANAILIGDSNAAHYLGMMRVFAKTYGFSLRNATQSSCPLVEGEFDWIYPKYEKGCNVYRRYITKEAEKYDTVIIGLNGPDYLDKQSFRKNFTKTINRLSASVKTVVLLGKVPTFPDYNKDCEIREIKLDGLNCAKRFDRLQQENRYNRFLKKIANEKKNVFYFGIRKVLCHGNICSPYLDGKPIYYNHGHLSMIGSQQIGEKLVKMPKKEMVFPFSEMKNLKQLHRTYVSITEKGSYIDFLAHPEKEDAQIAFYVYKNNKKIDTQWYSENPLYRLDKKKFGKGKYRIRYFIVKSDVENPGKSKNKERGFSDYVQVD